MRGCVLQLLRSLLQIHLRLLQLTDVSGGNVVATHLYRRANLRIEINYLRFQPLFVFGQQLFGGHHLRHGIIQLRHAVAHVADGLLKYEFGSSVFSIIPPKRARIERFII
jgi:hypothetical protein